MEEYEGEWCSVDKHGCLDVASMCDRVKRELSRQFRNRHDPRVLLIISISCTVVQLGVRLYSQLYTCLGR